MSEKKASDLNQVLAVVSGYETYTDRLTGKQKKSKIKPTIGIVCKYKIYPDMLGINYPMILGSDWQGCGGMNFFNSKKLISVRPATEEEIKEWRNAKGLIASTRKRANTVDKVKQLKWVKLTVGRGDELITSM